VKLIILKTRYLLICLSTLLLASCFENTDCVQENDSIIWVSFNKSSDNSFDTLAFASIEASNQPGVVVSDLEDTIKSNLDILIDPNNPEITLTFEADDRTGSDELVLSYDITPRLIAPNCGVEQLYSNLEVVRLSQFEIDSVIVTKNTLDGDSTQSNIRIYIN